MLGRIPAPRIATRARFTDGSGAEIDDGLALLFEAPRSFTGEDVLELHGHGGAVVSRMVLDRVCELGARAARAGEFTLRAFLNDRIDLAQAEAIADLIDSASASAARLCASITFGRVLAHHRRSPGCAHRVALVHRGVDRFPGRRDRSPWHSRDGGAPRGVA